MSKIKSPCLIGFLIAAMIQLGSGITWSMPIGRSLRTSGDSLPPQELLVVLTDDWTALSGTLYAFKKVNGAWEQEFSNPVVVGSKGLGLGEGLERLSIDNAPVKQEGDLKSPAGVFTIGTAFGYASYEEARWIKNPYIRATDTLICVDDSHSAHYNTLVNNNPAKSDWKSFESMHRKDDYYKWGLFINHNAVKPVSGKGSCIFMHIWENAQVGTDGCTAMREDDLLRILHWIDKGLSPILVQFPRSAYKNLAGQYHWPKISGAQ
jgi:D-alanyl-D-alanine dipeptidase